MNVLVSGVAGLYGVNIAEEMVNHNEISKVYGVDDFSRGFPPEEDIYARNWGGKVQIVKGKFQELTIKELDSMNLDVVIHLAGYNSRRESVNTPLEYFSNNEFGTFQLIQKLVRTKNRPFFIYASTIEVYGEPRYTPVDEGHPENPENLYAVTKLAAEKHLMAVGRWFNYPFAVLRFSSTYGENQNIYGFTSVISSFIDRALRNEPLIIYGTGKQTRDFIYVKDAAAALLSATRRQQIINGLIINIVTGQSTCICDLADKIKLLTNSSSEIIKLPQEKGEFKEIAVKSLFADKSLAWSPKYTLEQGLLRTIGWYKSLRSI